MKVSALFIYPIKSLQGISLPQVEVMEKGFRYDRRWMLVNNDNYQITQRTHPHLSQISISMPNESIIASYRGMTDREIPIVIENGKSIQVTVWDDQVEGLEASQEINTWFSNVVGEPCKLVFMPEKAARPISSQRAVNGEHVSFADGYPYLIIGQSSLDDLNSRMEVDLPMNRFRPNIVVEGSEPYEEDYWKDIQIGGVLFRVTHPCKRCVFTTVDQETGQKSAEPLKTLATYRKDGSEVIFGMNTLALDFGKVRVGDAVKLDVDSSMG